MTNRYLSSSISVDIDLPSNSTVFTKVKIRFKLFKSQLNLDKIVLMNVGTAAYPGLELAVARSPGLELEPGAHGSPELSCGSLEFLQSP